MGYLCTWEPRSLHRAHTVEIADEFGDDSFGVVGLVHANPASCPISNKFHADEGLHITQFLQLERVGPILTQ